MDTDWTSRTLPLLRTSIALVLGAMTSSCDPDSDPPPPPIALVFSGQPTTAGAGGAITPSIQVAVLNTHGNIVPDASNTITLAIGTNPSNGTLAGTTTVAAVNGVATFADVSIDKAGTGYTLTATATGLSGATSAAFAVTVAVAEIGAGFSSSCGITAMGVPFCWGANGGMFGDGSTTGSLLPSAAASGLSFASLSVGDFFVCGITGQGDAYCWGQNAAGNLGYGGQFVTMTTPVRVLGGFSFVAISAGYSHTCGIASSGAAYCWGSNDYGQLGNATTTSSLVPVQVSATVAFKSISVGGSHTCGVTTSGSAYCWGANSNGQLGVGSTSNYALPVAVSGDHTFASISAGAAHTCALTPSGEAYCWGQAGAGELGNGSTADSPSPTPVSGNLTFRSVSAGYYYTCGLNPIGAAYCWGMNLSGQLGNGSTASSPTPAPVSGDLTFRTLVAGSSDHTCGTTTQGTAYCWGANGAGQLGNGSTTSSSSPVAVLGGILWEP